MSVTYQYEKNVFPSKLADEIRYSSITVALNYIETTGIVLKIVMKAALSVEEEVLLDSIVAAHDPTPPVIPSDIRDLSNKQIIHETSKPFGLQTFFTSQGDNTSNPMDVGNGADMKIFHEIGDATVHAHYVDLNIAENLTELHEGYIMWQDATFDQVSLEAVTAVTNYTPDSSTNFNLYGGYLIIPAAGDGNIAVAPEDMKLVEMPLIEHTRIRPAAFWDASYNTSTHAYTDIIAKPSGDGTFNMFGTEVNLCKFVNKVMLSGSGFLMLQTADSKQLGQGMRLRLSSFTNNGDHDWKASCILTFHRERSV